MCRGSRYNTIRTFIGRAAIALAGLVWATCLAPRVAMSGPRLLLNADGPVGTVRCLAFSNNGQQLFVGGDAKSLQIWDLQPVGGRPRPKLTRTLHWPIARGHRGLILTAATSPRGDLLVFAGFGAYDSVGDIVAYDMALDAYEKVLDGHRSNVTGIAFSPRGRRMASASLDGEIRLWDTAAWGSTVVIEPAPKQKSQYVPLAFLSEDVLVCGAVATDDQYYVCLIDLNDKKPQLQMLSPAHRNGVSALGHDPRTGHWVSAAADGNVYLWADERDRQPQLLSGGPLALRTEFTPDGRLFILREADARGRAALQLWDVDGKKILDEVSIAHSGVDRLFACSVSPQGNQVAVATGDGTVQIYPLQDGNGAAIDKPLSRPPFELRGIGQTIGKVAFDARGGYRIGFGKGLDRKGTAAWNDYADIDRVFDFEQPGRPVPPRKEDRWRDPSDGSGNWSLRLLNDGDVVQLREKGHANTFSIRLGQQEQGKVRSYCWLTRPDGTPYAIALGTDENWGIYIYQLPQDGEPELIRYFRDHDGWVTSLSVSRDGKYLASASGDQTIKVWSLEGIAGGQVRPRLEQTWGATFVPHADRLLVRSMIEPGTTRRKFEVGDSIAAIQWWDGLKWQITDGAGPMQRLLEIGPLWLQYLVTVRRADNSVERTLIVPGWEPLLTLFVDRDDRWGVWTPEGYYDASADGDELFGWIINSGRFNRPRYFQADQMREDLERPNVIRQLLKAGNLSEAFRLSGEPRPAVAASPIVPSAEQLPEIRLLSPAHDSKVAGERPIDIVARIDPPAGGPMPPYAVQCYVNGVPAGKPHVERQATFATYRWTSPPIGERNRVRVTATLAGSAANAKYAFAETDFRATVTDDRHRLHIFMLASSEYQSVPSLKYPVKEAAALRESLHTRTSRFYEEGNETVMENYQIFRSSVDQAISTLRGLEQEIAPQDVLVVFVSGHGKNVKDEYYYVPSGISGADNRAVRDEGVPWSMLRRLAAVPCRKIFLFDSCHSGAVAASEEQFSSVLRPLRRSEVLVFAAAGPDQWAEEVDDYGYGSFTYFMLEALAGKADGFGEDRDGRSGQDGVVDLEELVHYVTEKVSEDSQYRQIPRATRSSLGFVPLSTW